MPHRHRAFVDRHELWSDEQRRAAAAVEREIKRRKLEVGALCVLPTSTACCAARRWWRRRPRSAMRAGVTMTSTLLAKDTSHRTVFPVFTRRRRHRPRRDGRAPAISSWSPIPRPSACCPGRNEHRLGAVRHLFPERQAGAVLDARALSRRAGASSPSPASIISPASRSNSSCSSSTIRSLRPTSLTWPAEAPAVEHTTHGFQYLTESRFDQVDPILEVLRKTMQALGLPLLSLEVELGPSQYEFTFAPERGLARRRHDGAVPQRHEAGGAAARPSRELHVPAAAAQHVRQRLASAPVAARPQDRARTCSSRTTRPSCCRRSAAHYLAGLLAHARGGGGVHHADHQRLQALSRRQLDGADPGDLGAATIAA